MSVKRRAFIPNMIASVLGMVAANDVFAGSNSLESASPTIIPEEEEAYWKFIRSQYRTGKVINLNNGGVSPHPIPVEEAFFNYHRMCNDAPSYSMWRQLEKEREELREKLAAFAGCKPTEVAINRNATEALVTIINQLPLQKGDEVVLSTFDYPRMMNAWKVRAEKEGIVLKWVNPEEGNPSDTEIIKRYTNLFSTKTKVVHITHMINWTGRLLPAKEIIEKARPQNILSVVDAAHSFAHIPFKIADLNCDYLGVSLHKWLGAPFGNGLLYVNSRNIENLSPIFPTEKELDTSIKKFEELGTRNNASEYAISQAIDFNVQIGAERKYKRLLALRTYWIDKVKQHPSIQILTPLEEGRSGVIALVNAGKPIAESEQYLMDTYKIHTVGISHEGITGLRISPNIYTTTDELDLLVKGLLELADK